MHPAAAAAAAHRRRRHCRWCWLAPRRGASCGCLRHRHLRHGGIHHRKERHWLCVSGEDIHSDPAVDTRRGNQPLGATRARQAWPMGGACTVRAMVRTERETIINAALPGSRLLLPFPHQGPPPLRHQQPPCQQRHGWLCASTCGMPCYGPPPVGSQVAHHTRNGRRTWRGWRLASHAAVILPPRAMLVFPQRLAVVPAPPPPDVGLILLGGWTQGPRSRSSSQKHSAARGPRARCWGGSGTGTSITST